MEKKYSIRKRAFAHNRSLLALMLTQNGEANPQIRIFDLDNYAGRRKGTLCNKALASKYCGYNEWNFVNLETRTDDSFLDEFSADK